MSAEDPLEFALRRTTLSKILFAVYVGFTAWVFVELAYNFAEAWYAPRCGSWRDVDLHSWCLPIGLEGPFSDPWANKSEFNARVSATFNLIFISSAVLCTIYLCLRGHQRSRAIAYYFGLAFFLVRLIWRFVLDDIS